ncbi:MAG: neutral/alkaline non-lysosomal ceramidase N-terminal domain-containing protein [Clostridia bacterium]|nr:neutral/alkaline non-lysosomal ceramidase N-terminal domain-containing protein [Clostridia bacterium]
MRDTFQAGAARADVTPQVGACLYGYRPEHHSTGIHDRLSLTAAAFRQGARSALLVTVEVGDIHNELCDGMRAALEKETGVPAANILLSATHTHCAPNVSGMEGWGEIDRPYYENILLPAALRAGREAVAGLRDAQIAVGTTRSDVGINRREIRRNGEVCLGQNPFGCYDPCMTVLTLRGTDGAGILNLIHYGCHGTAAGLATEVTRDWSGVMIDRVEKETGVLTAYWNGAEGDVGPRLTNGETTGDMSHVTELGGVAAADAMRALRSQGGFHAGTLRCFADTMRLPYRTLPAPEEVREKLASITQPEKLINIQRLTYKHYLDVQTLYDSGVTAHPTHLAFPFCAVSLGDVLFVPAPFEIFSEITLRLRAYLPWTHTLCLSNTNGYRGYFPSQDQICRGGYEVDCFVTGSVYNLVDDADQYYIDEVCRITGKE